MDHVVCRFFKDSSERYDLTNDYSSTNADDAVLTPAEGEKYLEIYELRFPWRIGDNDPSTLNAEFLTSGALSNGLTVKLFDNDDEVVEDLTDAVPIKTMDGLYQRSNAPIIYSTFDGSSPDQHTGVCIWRLPVPIIVRYEHSIKVGLSDDLSAATNLFFGVLALGRVFT